MTEENEQSSLAISKVSSSSPKREDQEYREDKGEGEEEEGSVDRLEEEAKEEDGWVMEREGCCLQESPRKIFLKPSILQVVQGKELASRKTGNLQKRQRHKAWYRREDENKQRTYVGGDKERSATETKN